MRTSHTSKQIIGLFTYFFSRMARVMSTARNISNDELKEYERCRLYRL